MFNYEVMSKQDAENNRFQLMEKGQYQAVFIKQTFKQSASGNPMLEVDLEVYDNNGIPHAIRDFLVFSKNMMWKVIHAAESIGKLEEYEKGTFGDVCLVGLSTIVDIDIQAGKPIPSEKLNGKPEGSLYPTRNVINDYIAGNKNITKDASKEAFNDDIPF